LEVGCAHGAFTWRTPVVLVARLRLVSFILALAVLAAPPAVSAVPIAIVSFDTFIPGPDGVNAFGIANATGDFSLPPDFPVMTPLTFLATALTVARQGGAIEIFALGGHRSGCVRRCALPLP
jgi:hypothetical protein